MCGHPCAWGGWGGGGGGTLVWPACYNTGLLPAGGGWRSGWDSVGRHVRARERMRGCERARVGVCVCACTCWFFVRVCACGSYHDLVLPSQHDLPRRCSEGQALVLRIHPVREASNAVQRLFWREKKVVDACSSMLCSFPLRHIVSAPTSAWSCAATTFS